MTLNLLKLACIFLPLLSGGSRTQSISSEAGSAVTRIACVGDSITYGHGLRNRAGNAWPARLGKWLGIGYDVRNFGVSGATMLSKANYPYIERPQYNEALQFKPDILIIMLGTNDSKHPGDGSMDSGKAPDNWKHKADYIVDYKNMIDAFRRANPEVKVYACLPTPNFPGTGGINDRTIREEMIPMIHKLAAEYDTKIIDLYTQFVERSDVFPDTVHPNDEGARLIAVEIYKALTGRSPAANANGVMLGSWNTQVEFDQVKVVCGSEVVLNDPFDTEQPGWQHDTGRWQVADGVYRQSSNAAPALTTYLLNAQADDYTVSVRVRKTGGSEGFLVGFAVQDPENYYWLNLGGWNNTTHRLEKSIDGYRQPIGPAVQGDIETGYWYDIIIQVEGRRIQCFLDGRQIFDLTDVGFVDDSVALPADNDKLNFGCTLIPDLAADPSVVDIDGMFYCYATTDGWGQGLATSGTPVVWVSKDFLNWSFEGSSFPSDFDLKYWAPSTVVRRNGKYYSFPTLDGKITAVTADSPCGPFLAPDGQHVTRANVRPYPIEQKHSIDAQVFVDDDGQAYMFWGMHRVVKLSPDLLEQEGPTTTIPVKRKGYSEGPFLFKRNGIYYYLYTLGGAESYRYAYMMSRTSPFGPWEAPEQDIISTTDYDEKVFGPGHGCFFRPQDSEQWYFVYLEFGRGSTNRQVYADKMNFNSDGTIVPVKLTKAGVGALRPVADAPPNLALHCVAAASSVRRNYRVRPESYQSLVRVETYAAANALDGCNGTRWFADGKDNAAWFQVDFGAPREIRRTEAYFVKPAAGHAYRLEWSLDGEIWQPYGGHDEVILRSPHCDEKSVRTRYLKLTITKGEPGIWEFRVY